MLLSDIEISGKTQNYRLKSVCNFKVTRFYLILPCKQHNWTSGTYSIEISTWSYENRRVCIVQYRIQSTQTAKIYLRVPTVHQ